MTEKKLYDTIEIEPDGRSIVLKYKGSEVDLFDLVDLVDNVIDVEPAVDNVKIIQK